MEANYFTILYWFCHTSTWIHNGCTRVPHPEPPFHLRPYTIPLGHPSVPAPSILYHASNLDWWFISHMILYMFQCHSPKSFHPHPHPQNPKDCFIHLCLLLLRGKNVQTRAFYSERVTFRIKGEIRNFSANQRLIEFINSKHTLHGIL